MNLHPSRDDPEAPLAPPEWTMNVIEEGFRDEAYYYSASICRRGVEVCKLSIYGAAITSKEMASRALATKARLWIDDYLAR